MPKVILWHSPDGAAYCWERTTDWAVNRLFRLKIKQQKLIEKQKHRGQVSETVIFFTGIAEIFR